MRGTLRRRTLLLGLAPEVGFTQAETVEIREASGIARHGEFLLIVDDSQHGSYFRFHLKGETGPMIELDPNRLERVPLPHSSMATDLESINVLADGRVVVLSERLRAMFDAEGAVADYGAVLSEFGKRGMEGLAVRPVGEGTSRAAVLWEGGYPQYYDVPEQLRAKVGRQALSPIVQVHDLRPSDRGVQRPSTGFEPGRTRRARTERPRSKSTTVSRSRLSVASASERPVGFHRSAHIAKLSRPPRL